MQPDPTQEPEDAAGALPLAELIRQARAAPDAGGATPRINPLLLADALLGSLEALARAPGAQGPRPEGILLVPEHSGYYWRARRTVLADGGNSGAADAADGAPSVAALQALAAAFAEAAALVPDAEQRSGAFRALQSAIAVLGAPPDGDAAAAVAQARQELQVAAAQQVLFPPVRIRTFSARSSEIPRELLRLVDTPAFQRQRKVSQLGMTQHVYPGATHTRFVHSLGVLDLANRYVEALRENDLAFATGYTPSRHVHLLAYALLHDVGHYPFAHYLEEIPTADLPAGLREVVHHERLGKLRYAGEGPLADARLRAALAALRVDFSGPALDALLGRQTRTLWGQIIDGPLDADKLDYLIRDGVACGVTYANAIDVERLVSSLTAVPMADGTRSLGISGKALAPAAELLIARYHMYTEVYFHKVCRSIAACIKKGFWLAARAGLLARDDFLRAAAQLDDEAFLDWLAALLDRLDAGAAAEGAGLLVRASLVSGERMLYKRAATLFDPYVKDAPTEEAALRRCAALRMEDMDAVESALAGHFAARLGLRVPKYAVLLDVPLQNAKDVSLPYVRDAQGRARPLDEVSPLCTGIRESLRRSRKVRLFLHPELHAAAMRAWSTDEVKQMLVAAINGEALD